MADNNIGVKAATSPTHEIHNAQVGTDGSIPIVEQVVQVSTLPALPAGSNVIGHVVVDSAPTTAVTQSGTWTVTASGSVAITGSVAVTGTFWQATQPVSAASLPLPTGAATAAKQPALGTAGSASADVLSVQGVAGGTAQPVSGTFWQATQPVSLASLPALATGSNVIGAVTQSGSWTTTVSGSVAVTGTFFQATQPVSIASSVTVAQATGSNLHAVLDASSAVIGHVINDASSAVIGHVISDTGSTTAVTGNVTVVQPTGTNLHVVVDSAPSTAVTGTVTANAGTNLNTSALALDATLTGGTQQTKITDGTNVANVVAPAAGQNAQLIAGSTNVVAFTTTTAQVLATTDCLNMRSVSVHIVTQGGSSTVVFQGSNDNTNWASIALNNTSNPGTNAAAIQTTAAATIFKGNVSCRYFRLNVTGIVSGTTAGTVAFFAQPLTEIGSALTANAAQQGTWTVQPGNTANTTPWNVTTGGTTTASVPANAANVVVKASAGRLFRVLVTTTGANPMLIYDNATTNSGTIIGALPASPAVGTIYDFEMPAANGITIAGSATNPAVTVSYSN